VESVHVELAHEGEEVVVFEVLREDLVGQPADALDNEAVSLWTPLDDVRVGRVLTRRTTTSTILKVLARKMGILFRTYSRYLFWGSLGIIRGY